MRFESFLMFLLPELIEPVDVNKGYLAIDCSPRPRRNIFAIGCNSSFSAADVSQQNFFWSFPYASSTCLSSELSNGGCKTGNSKESVRFECKIEGCITWNDLFSPNKLGKAWGVEDGCAFELDQSPFSVLAVCLVRTLFAEHLHSPISLHS